LLIGGWNHGHNPFLDHHTMDASGRSGRSTEAQITAALDDLIEAGGNPRPRKGDKTSRPHESFSGQTV
jgi:hypothetical protein